MNNKELQEALLDYGDNLEVRIWVDTLATHVRIDYVDVNSSGLIVLAPGTLADDDEEE